MNQKVEELARTLVQSGIAASESEAKRMAEEMISTETKVQKDFDGKKEQETMYGESPRTPKNSEQGKLNHNDSKPRPLNNEVKINPVDGTPITPVEEQKGRRDFEVGNVKNPHMSPEEYSASQLNIAKSTSELIEEEQMDNTQEANAEGVTSDKVVEEQETDSHEQETTQKNEEKITEEPEIPKPDDSDGPIEEIKTEEPDSQKNDDLPDLNPLEEQETDSHEQETTQKNEEMKQSGNNAEQSPKSIGSDGKPLPQTQTPERPEISDEEKAKMEEAKVDLTKIFKV